MNQLQAIQQFNAIFENNETRNISNNNNKNVFYKKQEIIPSNNYSNYNIQTITNEKNNNNQPNITGPAILPPFQNKSNIC